jgi:hypothetical protein
MRSGWASRPTGARLFNGFSRVAANPNDVCGVYRENPPTEIHRGFRQKCEGKRMFPMLGEVCYTALATQLAQRLF